MDSAQQQPINIAPSEENEERKNHGRRSSQEHKRPRKKAKIATNDQEEKEVGDGFGGNLDDANEDARDDEEEEEEEGENNQVGDGFGGNLDVDIKMEKKNGAKDSIFDQCQRYLEYLRSKVDIDVEIKLSKAIDDYFDRNGHCQSVDSKSLQEFITDELKLDAVAAIEFRKRIDMLQSTYKRLWTNVNLDGASCLLQPEVEKLRLGDLIFGNSESTMKDKVNFHGFSDERIPRKETMWSINDPPSNLEAFVLEDNMKLPDLEKDQYWSSILFGDEKADTINLVGSCTVSNDLHSTSEAVGFPMKDLPSLDEAF